ncbi:hypothetical protein K3495_g7290 [Podosphaera aphanis]|nr:hypothetical protein K3495_g7290 [Podosphaera aphanis]
MNPLLFLCSVLSVNFVQSLSTCWYPDGNTIDQTHVPCNQTSNAPSACCAPQDGCSGGLCVSIYGTYRGSCTDQSWNSPNCGAREWSQCINDPVTRRRYNRATPILPCSNPGTEGSNFCCGSGNGSCCNDQFQLGSSSPVYKPGLDVLVDSGIATSNTTNITNVPSTDGDIGEKIGLGIGVPLSVFVVGLLGFLVYREHHKKVMSDANTATLGLNTAMEQQNLYPNYSNTQSYPHNASAPLNSYSPPSPKPDPVYEAPVSHVHEMRG